MKITDVKAYPLKTRTALVRVFTDDGVEGVGECSPMNVQVMCHFVETVLRPLVLGKNPLDVERVWDAMYRSAAAATWRRTRCSRRCGPRMSRDSKR